MKWPECICVSSVNWSKEGQTRDKKNEIISEANYLIYIIWDWYVHLWIYMFTIKLIKCDSTYILVNFNILKMSVLCFGSSKPVYTPDWVFDIFNEWDSELSHGGMAPRQQCGLSSFPISIFTTMMMSWLEVAYILSLVFHENEFTMEWKWYKYKDE